MTGRKTLIRVGDDLILKKRNAIEEIDKSIRNIRDGIASGILLNTDDLIFLDQHDLFRPINSIKIAIDTYLSLISILSNTGLILLEE
jgi:hypothetical protein